MLGWKLWSEVNLTQAQGNVVEWHRKAAEQWHGLDPYRHPITTHWAGSWRDVNPGVAQLPGIDYICIDAYHTGGLLAQLLLEGAAASSGLGRFQKPILVTECGGNWNACPPDEMKAEQALADWAALVSGYAGGGMLWWFEFVDQHGLWAPYTAIGRFIAGEDLRGADASSQELTVTSPAVALWCHGWVRPGRVLGYCLEFGMGQPWRRLRHGQRRHHRSRPVPQPRTSTASSGGTPTAAKPHRWPRHGPSRRGHGAGHSAVRAACRLQEFMRDAELDLGFAVSSTCGSRTCERTRVPCKHGPAWRNGLWRSAMRKRNQSTSSSHAMSALVVGALLTLAPLGGVAAATVEVSTNAQLQQALAAAAPGTTIEVDAGTYAGGIYIIGVQGTSQAPIVVEATDPSNQPLFSGGGEAIHLGACSYITLRNLAFTGQTEQAINCDDNGDYVGPGHAYLTFENLTVHDMNSSANTSDQITNGIKLTGVDHFLVENCTVSNWGGANGCGIDCVGCHDSAVTGCAFTATDLGTFGAMQFKGVEATMTTSTIAPSSMPEPSACRWAAYTRIAGSSGLHPRSVTRPRTSPPSTMSSSAARPLSPSQALPAAASPTTPSIARRPGSSGSSRRTPAQAWPRKRECHHRRQHLRVH